MDFRQLKAFLTVGNLLNFTKAAEQLGYAQSSITAQIQQLENELGVKLFERIGKTVKLTYAGTAMIPYATQILQLERNLKADLTDSGVPAGTLTIGAAESLSIYRLPALLKEYRGLYPQVALRLKLLGCTEFLPELTAGTIDAAFTIGNRTASDSMVEEISLPEPIDVLVCPGHPLTRKEAVAPEDFENIPLLLTGKGCCYRGAFLNRLSEKGITPAVTLETDSIQAIKQAALSGLGICVLPRVSVAEEVFQGRLIPLPFDTEDFDIVSQLIYHRDKWLSPALRAFLQLSHQILPESPCDRT
ncbi:MAG TPA: LysR family transcriptional regulator [Caproiciproducens sp.]|nr:LysR family transcriptional regulator [Caproiciproducens sp.]